MMKHCLSHFSRPFLRPSSALCKQGNIGPTSFFPARTSAKRPRTDPRALMEGLIFRVQRGRLVPPPHPTPPHLLSRTRGEEKVQGALKGGRRPAGDDATAMRHESGGCAARFL